MSIAPAAATEARLIQAGDLALPADGGSRGRFWNALHTLEDLALSAVLGAMVLLPLAEIVLRGALGAGIANAATVVQHGVLVVGMLGAAVAAREGRLLGLASLGALLPPGARAIARAGAA